MSDPLALALDLLLASCALGVALALRPWRVVPAGGPPGLWGVWALAMAPAWVADRFIAVPLAQPLSGACLLMLMMGWPLAVLALVPVSLLAAGLGGLDPAMALQRGVWLGLVPATLALALGALVRRHVAQHLFVYILGRGFFVPALVGTAAGALSLALHGTPTGLQAGDLLLGRGLAAWGDAWLCGMITAILVAFRPHWLATYADRLYLPPPPGR
jgi:uncharacterized membrane protein